MHTIPTIGTHQQQFQSSQAWQTTNLHLHLQAKARISFKKLLKTQGNLTSTYLAYFYLSDSNTSVQHKSMQLTRTKLKQFSTSWVKFTS